MRNEESFEPSHKACGAVVYRGSRPGQYFVEVRNLLDCAFG